MTLTTLRAGKARIGTHTKFEAFDNADRFLRKFEDAHRQYLLVCYSLAGSKTDTAKVEKTYNLRRSELRNIIAHGGLEKKFDSCNEGGTKKQ